MNWLQRILGREPKAKRVEATGNHIENLAAHRTVTIEPIGTAAGLPVWVDVPAQDPTTATYDGLLWEVEPLGEYLYFLAGPFPKNEKGLLRYEAAQTVAEVYVSFEDDVIAVERAEMQHGSDVAQKEMTDSSDFSAMRVADITAFAQNRSREAGYARRLATLAVSDLHGGVGYMEQADDVSPDPWVRLLWSKQTETGQGTRITKITVRSSDPDQDFAPIHDLFETLMDRYQDIAKHPLSGAIRI